MNPFLQAMLTLAIINAHMLVVYLYITGMLDNSTCDAILKSLTR